MPLICLTEDFPLCLPCFEGEVLNSINPSFKPDRPFIELDVHRNGYVDGRGCEKCGGPVGSDGVQCAYLDTDDLEKCR